MSSSTVTPGDTLVIRGGTVVELSPPGLRREDIVIREGRLVEAGEAGPRASTTIDASGCLVMPGLVCGHGHLYSALATGMPGPTEGPTCFTEILERVWWRLDEALDEPSLRSSVLVGALGAIRCGTTSIIDHHASPSFIDGSLDVIAEALEEVGLRGVLCYEVTDRGGLPRRDAGLRENERFIGRDLPFARGLVGGHASFTMSEETLEACVDIAKRQGSGLHVHLAEDAADQRDSEKKYGLRVAKRLARSDALRPRTLLVHGVHLDAEERDLVASSPSWIAHNPRSNMNNSVGYANPTGLSERLIIGTDGIGADMFAESQHAFFRAREQALSADAGQVLGWLMKGAELVSELFGQTIGQLQPGAAADVVVLDAQLPTPLTAGNLPWYWMFGLSSRMVRDVVMGGRVILRDRQFQTVDERAILAESQEQARALWSRL